MITDGSIRPESLFIEKTRIILETSPKDFLNQSMYDSTIIVLVQHCQTTELDLLCRLCALNTKRFLPFWGIVIDQYKHSNDKSTFLELFKTMVFNIGPFIEGTSSKKTNLGKISYETLSQSINRHINFLIDECKANFETSFKYLSLYRKIMKNINRQYDNLDELISLLITLMRGDEINNEELSKFICLLVKKFNVRLSPENFHYLISLGNDYITKALIRKHPFEFDCVCGFNDDFLGEYCLGVLENSSSDLNILTYLERLSGNEQFIRQVIASPYSHLKEVSSFLADLMFDRYQFMLPEFVKYTDQSILIDIIGRILKKQQKDETDWETLANSLNRLDEVACFVDKIDVTNLSFQKLRCHLALVKKGQRYGFDPFKERFIHILDAKELIILTLIILELKIPIDSLTIEAKLSTSGDSRLIRHLKLLYESNYPAE